MDVLEKGTFAWVFGLFKENFVNYFNLYICFTTVSVIYVFTSCSFLFMEGHLKCLQLSKLYIFYIIVMNNHL